MDDQVDASLAPMLAPETRAWLQAKIDSGVKQVRVASVLERLNVELPPLDDELVGTGEAAVILSVEKPRLAKWIRNGLVPTPVAILGSGPVWLRSQIIAVRAAAFARKRVPREVPET
jgi:hypothetical protein